MNSIICVLPAVLAILLVFLTRRLIPSILAGLLAAAVVVWGLNPIKVFTGIVYRIAKTLELSSLTSVEKFLNAGKLPIFLFLIVLGVTISLILESGSGADWARLVFKKARTRVQAELSQCAVALTMFVDDYLAALISSCVMPQLADRVGTSRLKVSFLTTAFAAPFCVLVPVSSWAAVIVGFIETSTIAAAGVEAKAGAFLMFCKAIPMIFYCWLIMIAGILAAAFGFDFGEIAKAQDELKNGVQPAQKSGIQEFESSCKTSYQKDSSPLTALLNFFVPIVTTSVGIIVAILILGGLLSGKTVFRAFLDGGSNSAIALLAGSIFGLLCTAFLYISNGRIRVQRLWFCLFDGFGMMRNSIITLTLAWTLASFLTGELHTDIWLATRLAPFLNPNFLPFSVFLLSAITAFSLGSAWATMTIVFPMILPLAERFGQAFGSASQSELLVLLTIGAILSGAVWGSGMSPIADLLVMTSRNTGVDHLRYVKTQMQYLFPVGLSSALAFFVAGKVITLGYLKVLLIAAIVALFALIVSYWSLTKLFGVSKNS